MFICFDTLLNPGHQHWSAAGWPGVRGFLGKTLFALGWGEGSKEVMGEGRRMSHRDWGVLHRLSARLSRPVLYMGQVPWLVMFISHEYRHCCILTCLVAFGSIRRVCGS